MQIQRQFFSGLCLSAGLIFAAACSAESPAPSTTNNSTDTKTMTESAMPRVEMKTNQGSMIIELNDEKAPNTVKNFLAYVDSDHFAGTIFHRVIKGFMAQGGGFTADFQQKDVNAPIRNEANNGLKNDRGTIAMARTGDPHSATAQFFINDKDNDFLNFRAENQQGWGYTVFGKVVEGMDVLDKITAIPTGPGGPFPTDAPKETVLIESVSRVQ